jgi:hypothetical protein
MDTVDQPVGLWLRNTSTTSDANTRNPMRTALVVLIILWCTGCAAPLSPRERDTGLGYVLGSGIGAGIGAATGNPLLGALAGGPAGALAGWSWARGGEQEATLAALQLRVAAQDEEIRQLRWGLQRLGQREWLEP